MSFKAALTASAMLALSGTTALAAETPQEAANKKAVLAFYEAGLNKLDFDAAKPFLGATYRQHNPGAKDGVEGFQGFVSFLKTSFPQTHSTIVRSFADGDYVVLHVHNVRTPGTAGNAIVDIFRLEKGKIVEHWDVVQAVPDKPANTNTMF